MLEHVQLDSMEQPRIANLVLSVHINHLQDRESASHALMGVQQLQRGNQPLVDVVVGKLLLLEAFLIQKPNKQKVHMVHLLLNVKNLVVRNMTREYYKNSKILCCVNDFVFSLCQFVEWDTSELEAHVINVQ